MSLISSMIKCTTTRSKKMGEGNQGLRKIPACASQWLQLPFLHWFLLTRRNLQQLNYVRDSL